MSTFKVGDKVECTTYGKGVITAIEALDTYPVKVSFNNNGGTLSFTMKGKCIIGDDARMTLSIASENLPIDTLPPLEEEPNEHPIDILYREMGRLFKKRIMAETIPSESPYKKSLERMNYLIKAAEDIRTELQHATKEISRDQYIYKTISKQPMPPSKVLHTRWDELYHHLRNLNDQWERDMEKFRNEK